MTNHKMNPEIKAQWVAALRSGEYQQGTGSLRRVNTDSDQYCCLGVLCQLAVDSGAEVHFQRGNNYATYDDNGGALPASVMEWAGVYDPDPRAAGLKLSIRNDGGASFSEIADLIEEHL